MEDFFNNIRRAHAISLVAMIDKFELMTYPENKNQLTLLMNEYIQYLEQHKLTGSTIYTYAKEIYYPGTPITKEVFNELQQMLATHKMLFKDHYDFAV